MTATPVINDPAELRLRLAPWLSAHGALAPGMTLNSVLSLAKGQSSDMMELVCRAKDGAPVHYILRREPRAKQLFLRPDAVREFKIMQAVERQGTVPMPHMIAAEPDEAVLGAPFFIMSKIEGFVPLGRPSMHQAGPLPGLTPEIRHRLWDSAISALAAIHAIDWQRALPFLLAEEKGQAGLENHLARLTEWYKWVVNGRSFPLTDKALLFLHDARAEAGSAPSVLLWNDARPGNMIFAPTGDVAAVIDWEGAITGPAGIDLGYWVMMDEFHAEAIEVPRLPGWPTSQEAVRVYETRTGCRVPNLDYFVVMAAFFIATTLIRQADLGIAAGRLPADTRMGHDNTTTQMIARRLGLPAPPLSPDYAAHRQLKLANG